MSIVSNEKINNSGKGGGSKLKYILAILLVIGLIIGYQFYQRFYVANVPSSLTNEFLLIPTGSTFDELVINLKENGFIQDENSFRSAAEYKKFGKKIRAGRFRIKENWTNQDLINHLRAGEQEPVKVVMNGSERLLENVAGKVGRFLESDSLKLYQKFYDIEYLKSIGYDTTSLMTVFIPNTYEMYWNTTPEAFIERMVKEHDSFWKKNDRAAKAEKLGLSQREVYSLASIVERETLNNEEKPRIASAYLNRLRIGMKLQADPTSVFATRDFDTHRVTTYHTSYDSPFNTYVYKGLPPGPISMATIPSIDAVLEPEQTNYLYFCARPDNSGTHAFAETFQQHLVNVEKYKAWMRMMGY